ncbi:MAG: hypothetical protein WCN98_11715, partial [Verrucomicrobiaceae bacterium]
GEKASGLQANTLAALSELLSGHWLTREGGGDAGYLNPILVAAGAALPIARSGPAFPFLVGSSNAKGVTFGDQTTLYRMMGRALRSWVTDPTVQDKLIAYTIANWDSIARLNPVVADVLLKNHEGVFQAYGFSEVNLGLDRFEEYSSERFARRAAEWLHQAHLIITRQSDPTDGRPPEELIDDFAGRYLISFLRDARINEAGPDNNDVIDAIRPIDYMSNFDRVDAYLLAACVEGVPNSGLKEATWVSRIDEFLPAFADEFTADQQIATNALAQEWVKEQAKFTLAAAGGAISRFGLAVAARVVELADLTCLTTVTELAHEAAEFDRLAADHRSYVAAVLSSNKKYPPSHPDIASAIREGLWYAGHYRVEAHRCRVASGLLNEYSKNFLRPLGRSIDSAFKSLDLKGFIGDGFAPPVVRYWSDGSVPDRLVPPKNERLVITTDSFRDRCDDLVKSTFDDESLDDSLALIRTDIIGGAFLDKMSETWRSASHALDVNQTWVIDPSIVGAKQGVATPATFTVRFDPADLLERSRAWLRHSNAFKTFLTQDLRGYLSEGPDVDPKELNARQNELMAALQSALETAEPLVRVDASLRSLLYASTDDASRARPGSLPFKDHPMEGKVKALLAGVFGHVDDFNVASVLTTDPQITSIPISSTLAFPHDPLVFESISSPIISSWNSAKNTPAAANFWSFRRARPMSEFVPVSPALLRAMIRGWFTGLALGRINREDLTIQRSNGEVAAFPQDLLNEVDRSGSDLLPAVLESLGLSYLQVAQLLSTSPLDAYSELRDLGSSAGVEFRFNLAYPTLNSAFDTWLDDGTFLVKGRNPIGNPVFEGLGGSDRDSRRDAAAREVQEWVDSYEASEAEYEDSIRKNPDLLGPSNSLWIGLYGTSDREGPLKGALNDLLGAFSAKDAKAKPKV